jgi:hypothetical protein
MAARGRGGRHPVEFAQFYQDGGFFMHVITVLGAIATGALVRGVLERRMANARGLVIAPNNLVPRLSAVVVLVGVLATIDGCTQLLAALRTVPEAQWSLAGAHGGQIVLIPIGWALTIASTLLFADAMLVSRRAPAASS